MDATYYLGLVKMDREGTRRMRETMAEMNLPAPEFKQKQQEVGHHFVRVRLRNEIEKRRVWVDQDISKIVGEALVAQFKPEEKRLLNWIAEYQKCNVNQAMKCLDIDWGTAKKILIKLVQKEVLQYVRFKPLGDRDSQAFFRLKGQDKGLPDNAWDASEKV